jgi:hypothetical protein
VDIACAFCGTLFHPAPSAVYKGLGKFCSLACYGAWQSAHGEGKHTRGAGGKRADLDNRYFRSSWEANYARYLNWLVSLGQIAGWEYEADTFEFTTIKRGQRFYTPDFKLTNLDGSIEYHEIKGWMDAHSRTKLDRMRRYYPTIKVVVIDGPAYKALARDIKRIIPHWESLRSGE